MDRKELRKLIVGPIGAIPTPFDDEYEVDLGAMRAMVQRIVDGGVSNGDGVIKIASALGEGPMLSDDEWPALLRTAVQAADGRAPVMLGIHHKDTKRTIEDSNRAADLGASGLQIAPPIYNIPTQQDMYDYFCDVSDAIDIGIMIYHTKWMPGGEIETETFLRMADIDNVVAVKWSGSLADDYEDMQKFSDVFNIIDNTADPVRCIRMGGHGYVQTVMDANPQHEMRVWGLLKAGRYDEAQTLYHSVYDDVMKMYGKVGERTGGQSTVIKALSAVVGHPIGDPRPPSKGLNDAEKAELRELVRGWGWTVAD